MSVSLVILAPLLSLALVLAGTQVVLVLAGALRTREYRNFEDRSARALRDEFPIPPTSAKSEAEHRRHMFSPLLEEAHSRTNATQTSYHNAVARSTGALAVAFVGLVLGTLPPENWQWVNSLLNDDRSVERLLGWLDAIAIVLVLLLFLYARGVNRRWIAARSGTELLRQSQFLSVIFHDPGMPSMPDQRTPYLTEKANAIKQRVDTGPMEEIAPRIERFWSETRAAISTRSLAESGTTPDALQVYLQRRVRRQLGWFLDSKARLEHIAERRNILLLSLYLIATALAIAKLALIIQGQDVPGYLLSLLLIATGLSAALTAYYINQNSRSLVHRYNTQARQIRAWLRQFDSEWPFAELPTLMLAAPDISELRGRILEFEDLMIEELVDWVHISSNDAIELAP